MQALKLLNLEALRLMKVKMGDAVKILNEIGGSYLFRLSLSLFLPIHVTFVVALSLFSLAAIVSERGFQGTCSRSVW